jgi:hypothetical protein
MAVQYLRDAMPGLASDDIENLVTQLKTARDRHTKPPRPYNQLRAKWADGLSADIAKLDLKLEALEAGDTEEEAAHADED